MGRGDARRRVLICTGARIGPRVRAPAPRLRLDEAIK